MFWSIELKIKYDFFLFSDRKLQIVLVHVGSFFLHQQVCFAAHNDMSMIMYVFNSTNVLFMYYHAKEPLIKFTGNWS